MEELPNILWSFRTTLRQATEETPFIMVHGAKVVLPAEIKVETAQVLVYTPKGSEVAQVEELDLVEEKRIQMFYQME